MRIRLAMLTMLIAQSACADSCITRYFDNDQKALMLEGYRATAWFYGSTHYLLSIAHFVEDAPVLGRGEWRMVDVQQHGVTTRVDARLLAVINAVPEGFALFELRERLPNAEPLKLREKPLSRNEPVRSVAYVDGLRFAKGRFVEIMPRDHVPPTHPFAKVPPGAGLFEMWDIEERYDTRHVLDHGASGAPIVDCEGNVAAVTSSFMTHGSLRLPGREIRLATPWGMPNNTASLIQPLFRFALPR